MESRTFTSERGGEVSCGRSEGGDLFPKTMERMKRERANDINSQDTARHICPTLYQTMR
jgi:hypothetical protein